MKVVTVGRSFDNDVINDSNVSRHHCQIILHDDGAYSLSDFGSTNGTYVNVQRVYGEVKLFTNDIVKIGTTILTWEDYFKIIKYQYRCDGRYQNYTGKYNRYDGNLHYITFWLVPNGWKSISAYHIKARRVDGDDWVSCFDSVYHQVDIVCEFLGFSTETEQIIISITNKLS